MQAPGWGRGRLAAERAARRLCAPGHCAPGCPLHRGARPGAGGRGRGRAGRGLPGGCTRPGPRCWTLPSAAPRLHHPGCGRGRARCHRPGVPGRVRGLAGARGVEPGTGVSRWARGVEPRPPSLSGSPPQETRLRAPCGEGAPLGHPDLAPPFCHRGAPSPPAPSKASRARGASAPAPRDSGRTGARARHPNLILSARSGVSAGIPGDRQPPRGSARPGAPLGGWGEGR